MAAFDALPLPLRRLLNGAVASWSAQSIGIGYLGDFQYGGAQYAWRETVRFIQRAERLDTLADYGPTHPEATPQ